MLTIGRSWKKPSRKNSSCAMKISLSEPIFSTAAMRSPRVILSGVGAHATTQSKDPEDALRADAASGKSLETKRPSLERKYCCWRTYSAANPKGEDYSNHCPCISATIE